MNKKPYISILTASLNSETTIERTLISIKTQSFRDFEHIVIDGNSIDSTVKIIKQYESAYNLKWISEPDSGIADALNKGFNLSNGRYILVIQADDSLISNDILEKIYPSLKTDCYDIHSFPVILDHPGYGRIIKKPIRHLWWNHFKFIFPHQGCFVKKSIFEKLEGFDTRFKINMDYDFFYRALSMKALVNFGVLPVTLMGGKGIGCDQNFFERRLKEERMVQLMNESNPFWRFMQLAFHILYFRYKKNG